MQIQKSGDLFRLLYNTKGRFVLHRISEEESKFKLCRVNKVEMSKNKIPYLVTHDGRTIRYPDPLIKVIFIFSCSSTLFRSPFFYAFVSYTSLSRLVADSRAVSFRFKMNV